MSTLEDGVQAVLELHALKVHPAVTVVGVDVTPVWELCEHCWRTWPCETVQLLADVKVGPPPQPVGPLAQRSST